MKKKEIAELLHELLRRVAELENRVSNLEIPILPKPKPPKFDSMICLHDNVKTSPCPCDSLCYCRTWGSCGA